jgi:F-type H+-transporting ATPase subunit gamma
MELVAAAKMRKAVAGVLASRPYSSLAWETIRALGEIGESRLHPLLEQRETVSRILVVLITSDRGLCGGFNAQMLKKITDYARAEKEAPIDFITVGKRGQDALARLGLPIIASWNGLSAVPTIVDVRPVATLAMQEFLNRKYDKVVLAYTDFISSLRQAPKVRQLLPLVRIPGLGAAEEIASGSELGQSEASSSPAAEHFAAGTEYIFEPSPFAVLDLMLPRLVETQVYQAVLESSASEQSARMLAMRNATDSAGDMIDDLTFTYNQARQAAITREIAEISAGKAALA